MQYNSFVFLGLFFVLVLLAYYIAPLKARWGQYCVLPDLWSLAYRDRGRYGAGGLWRSQTDRPDQYRGKGEKKTAAQRRTESV